MTSSATLNCLVWVHAFQMEVMGIDACSCWGHWQASASAGLVLGAVSQWLWLWPGAFGSASTLAPGLAVLRVWAWAVSTLLVLALKHFGTKLQRSSCNITHVLIFNLLLFVNILVLTVDVLSSNLLNYCYMCSYINMLI